MAHDITVIIDDLPGALAKIGETLGNSGVNIDMVYMGTNSRLVVAVYDLDKARSAV